MQAVGFAIHDPELGSFDEDHRLPLVRLRERRRELAMLLGDAPSSLTRARIREIAEVHQALDAIEAIVNE